ncbi:leucine-rich repeat protein [Candidatus Saccharibacteria bacterium]|nr:leucine-rich repeat protein [Candidatus Saccharibacteria bacterium]
MKYLALFVAVLAVGAISSGDANAASTFDTYTDGDGVVWDRETTDDGDIYIGIQSVPSGVTTVTVPAIGDVASGEDTYFLDAVCSRITDCSGVISDTAAVTVLDMTNASKIQIRNVSQMFNANHEVELIFGENVVIADPSYIDWSAYHNWGNAYAGVDNNPFGNLGAFAGMRVNLTNLGNVKYIGWNAFKNATLNAGDTDVIINSNQTVGGYVFAGTNITSLSFDAGEMGQGFAKDCSSLTSLTIGDNVTRINGYAFANDANLEQNFNTNNITGIYTYAFRNSGITGVTFGDAITTIEAYAFSGTDLGDVSFANTNVEYIEPFAFKDAGITSLDLGDVIWIGNQGFADNLMTEIYLPKSMRFAVPADGGGYKNAVSVFEHAPLKKLTIACDLSVTSMPQAGRNEDSIRNVITLNDASTWDSIEEIVVLAPYGENESPAADHDYTSVGTVDSGSNIPNSILNSSKNVIPRSMFAEISWTTKKAKRLILDDRFEIIGTLAFNNLHISELRTIDADGNISEDMRLPSSLKALGSHAFVYSFEYRSDMNQPVVEISSLPETLEFIGNYAFLRNEELVIDSFDIPNLEYLGGYAFYDTNVKNITLHAAPNTEDSLFKGSLMVESITIDYDFYGNSQSGLANLICPNSVKDHCDVKAGTGQLHNTGTNHLSKITFTDKATTEPNGTPFQFQGLYVDEVDLSATPWKRFYGTPAIFIGMKAQTLKLPHALESIGAYMFCGVEVTNPVELPNTLKEIGDGAFMAKYLAAGPTYPDLEFNAGINITSLPESIEKIGNVAFYENELLTADVNLPNLTELGYSAFQGTNVRDVTLNDGITKLGYNVFYDTPSLRNVTIDMDIYDENITRIYDGYEGCYQQSGEACSGTAAEQKAQHDANYYDSFVATFGTPDHEYGTITFTENAGEPCEGHYNCSKDRAYFYGLKADKVDLSATNWQSTGESMFQESEIGELILPSDLKNLNEDVFYEAELGDVSIPTTLVAIQPEAFQWATANIDGLPEGLGYIGRSAFYGTDVTDNLVIPSTVGQIGADAFNAGDEDVHYDTITIKPSFSSSGSSSGKLIFQLFWGADVDKMIITSMSLPASTITVPEGQDKPEFYGMPMDEVVITNLYTITEKAFQDCTNLQKVDMSSDANLRVIYDKAFVGDSKLDTIMFSPALKDEIVIIGQYAFEGTAFKTMGDNTKQFDLTAAKFNATDGFAFSKMPLLETVDVPATFSNLTVPEATFANDPELRLVTIDYHLDTIDNAAFSNDNKLESIFIWGDTEILDENLAGRGGDAVGPEYGPTIPEPTDIYAYSTSRAEEYAALPVRGTFEGDFYPLDEVLYLTSNKPTVLLNDDETDFDKSDLVVYAMRRDGIILESDEWSTYDGNAYPRSTSSVDFEHMAEKIQEDPVFGSIHDTPVPMNELDVTTNVNFENIDFALVPTEENPNVKKVTLLYNDKYTDNLADTDILPYQEKEDDDEEPAVPDTGVAKAMATFTKAALPIVAIVSFSLLGGVIVFKKRKN